VPHAHGFHTSVKRIKYEQQDVSGQLFLAVSSPAPDFPKAEDGIQLELLSAHSPNSWQDDHASKLRFSARQWNPIPAYPTTMAQSPEKL